MADVIIVGGGASGMACAVFAAEAGNKVHVFERNEKLGKKLFITGKGRCNFTNNCDIDELFDHVVSNPKFLYSAFYGFTSQNSIEFFKRLGVDVKVERGNRVFPASNHSSDIIKSMENKMRELHVDIHLNVWVKDLIIQDEKACGIVLEDNKKIYGDYIVLAAGGNSYPVTGSNGDGLIMAKRHNIPIKPVRPALVPLIVEEEYVPVLQGLSLRNVKLKIMDKGKILYDEFGELLFTHFGISGPLALSASSIIAQRLEKRALQAYIDLKPALSLSQMDQRLIREFDAGKNKQFKNVIHRLFPSKLIPVMLALSDIPEDKTANEITKEERRTFAELIKNFPMTIIKTRGFHEAIITQGGIDIKAVNPVTMEIKSIKNLFSIGEMLNLDALTGGFNLQIAWSTAYAAANGIQRCMEEKL
ncbi:NAD(P)/FAD-dependent oxidoreductase [Blautia liquoris]|uniref:NAD(P)/FAD-dependent oxidoreductase n=1 Tax=Blautia liquoris TaxID=2779518 RepID=A0A7M2RKX5_9FIRM|nr:NAD(P)/FAD-dependent oxidoreductase [Blautia liquoris]QOV20788.1 NAD(P)/FAD-dependent oxidoreductase [Blautia liquoris]